MGFPYVILVFTGLRSFTGFHWILPSFTRFSWIPLCFTKFYLYFPNFYWVLRVFLGFIGFDYFVFVEIVNKKEEDENGVTQTFQRAEPFVEDAKALQRSVPLVGGRRRPRHLWRPNQKTR